MEVIVKKVGELKVGNYIYNEQDGEVYKIVSIETSKPGKHGSAKARIEAISVTSGKKIVIIKPTSDPIKVPQIKKIKGQIIATEKRKVPSPQGEVEEVVAQVMDLETYEVIEAKVPEELKDKVEPGANVIVWDLGVPVVMQVFKQ
uniref:Translation initiation factor 5A n=1 Tax=Nanoarchaeum equitans (strain Kin4-M) TaxID=228908 RepID=IF5A_NANEQ|nr:RecName: Full=Translation initiation factor 5A; AltName: Full=Hypusine-containing protein; AltName: Full=eIF-5A [Nanoarchaeum equitans Kin4-M]